MQSSLGIIKRLHALLTTALLYLNGRLWCPVCDMRVSKFLPIHKSYEDNFKRYGFPYGMNSFETLNSKSYGCPRCTASDRERLYALLVNQTRNRSVNCWRVLDFAPSRSFKQYMQRIYGDSYETSDMYADGYDLRLDITKMTEVPDSTYDVVICSHVLEHVVDDRAAISELYRVMKEDAWGMVMVPICLDASVTVEADAPVSEAEAWRLYGQNDHVRLYTRDEFIRRLRSAGFIVHSLGQDYFGQAAFKRHGILDRSVLYVVTKSSVALPADIRQ